MRMRKGVKIYLVPRTKVPLWIRVQDLNVEIDSIEVSGEYIRVVSLRRGEAMFGPGGRIALKMPGSSHFLTSFKTEQVLEIRDAQDELIKRNWYCCKKCMTLSGYPLDDKPGSKEGYRNRYVACNCGHTWKLENI